MDKSVVSDLKTFWHNIFHETDSAEKYSPILFLPSYHTLATGVHTSVRGPRTSDPPHTCTWLFPCQGYVWKEFLYEPAVTQNKCTGIQNKCTGIQNGQKRAVDTH